MGNTSTTPDAVVKVDREKELVDLQLVLVRADRIERHAELPGVATPPVDAIWMAQKLRALVGRLVRDAQLIKRLDEQLQLFHQGQGVLGLVEVPVMAMRAAQEVPS